MTDSVSRRAGQYSSPSAPTLPPSTVGTLLDRPFVERLARATAGTTRLVRLGELGPAQPPDLLVVDPRRLSPTSRDTTAVYRFVRAQVPCVYYTASTQAALRAVVAATELTPVRLVLFDVDDDPPTLESVIALAPRHAHAFKLREAMRELLRPLVPSVRTTLDMVLRKPEQFFDAHDLARRIGLSRRHLDRVLTQADLAPAKNWIVGARAWHAVFLIACSQCSVEQTASRLGYADTKALRRHLSAVWRKLPTQLTCAELDVLLRELATFLHTRETDAELPSTERNAPRH